MFSMPALVPPSRKDVIVTLVVHTITIILAIALPFILEYHPAPDGLSRFWPILAVVLFGLVFVGSTLERLVKTMPKHGMT
jgi:drug/metabolite transporter (DMT)-like permease